MASGNNNQDAFYEGDFIDEGSFLVLTPGDLAELRGASSVNDRDRSATNNLSNSVSVNASASGDFHNAGNPPNRATNSAPAAGNVNSNGLAEPVSSYFQQNSMETSRSINGDPAMAKQDEGPYSSCRSNQHSGNHDVSLATVISSMGSVSLTPSEANSLEEAAQLVATLRKENDELKEALMQRNEMLRNTLRTLNTSVVTVETKHADQLQKYEDCKKSIAELRTENEQLRDQLRQHPTQTTDGGFEKLESLETQINQKDEEIASLNNKIKEYVTTIGSLEKEFSLLQSQEKLSQMKVDDLTKKRDDIQFELTDCKITIAKLVEENKKLTQELELLKQAQRSSDKDEIGQLKSALGETRLHMTRQKECIEDKDKAIASLQTKITSLLAENEQKMFLEAQMKEFESNFKEERNDKNKLADELSVLKIELEKKSAELEKLHQTHMVLANEHLNRNSAIPAREEFVMVPNQNQNVGQRQSQVQTSPSPQPSAPRRSSSQSSEGASSAPPVIQEQPQGLQPCPLCNKKFATHNALAHHASNCGIDHATRTNPFIYP